MLPTPLLLVLFAKMGDAQLNLGSFSLHPNQGGGFDLGLSQAANILGFGGDRGLKLSSNGGGVGVSTNEGALIGGERVGLSNGFTGGSTGVDLNSQLQFGNNPQPMHPAGQLGNFFDNVRNFFSFLGAGMPMSPAQPPHIGLPPPTIGVEATNPPTLIDTDDDDDTGRGSPSASSSSARWTEGATSDEELTNQESTEPGADLRPDSDSDTDVDESPSLHERTETRHRNVESGWKNVDELKRHPSASNEQLFSASTERPRQLPGLIEFA